MTTLTIALRPCHTLITRASPKTESYRLLLSTMHKPRYMATRHTKLILRLRQMIRYRRQRLNPHI